MVRAKADIPALRICCREQTGPSPTVFSSGFGEHIVGGHEQPAAMVAHSVARSPVAAFGRASHGYLLIVAAPAEHTTSS